jgi:predicted PurR-regulated permease PerM
VLVGALPILLIFGVGVGLGSAVHALKVDFHGLTEKVAQVLNEWRLVLPEFLVAQLPNDSDTQDLLVSALKERVGAIAAIGKEWLIGAVQVIIGTIIGVLIYLDKEKYSTDSVGAKKALRSRAHLFLETFRNIITAQFFIALINTALTAVFLLVLLPLLGISLPFTTALLAMTFTGGLLPIVGNLICNTVLTLVALSVGPAVAVGSLAFLIIAHKAEYIVNSITVGRKMTISAWELLVAIVLGEAVFGISGLVAAPLYYAYFKQELKLSRFA